ncbi:DUF6020 family protein [Flavitalea sp. BT771]|uniref:DUF6020 family protein n=1 Tax=Flavitalea sp. BT771 TaxID=3063329 RepID=UPI0026E35E38|nr:DUF6020 family protein [Flavitalea sp. BT771]MDO6433887.1 DUF6020 family protein [Flavitalea sp. BT771]MDV6222208.1 DUF6020 family protein [Flavitalea sp. BT771]
MNQAFVLPQSVAQESRGSAESFLNFIWKNKVNRRYLLIALGGTIVQFVIFKILYPFPDFFSDSYSYLYAAYANLDVSIWPIGYSKFLSLFHSITQSHTLLVAFQYFILEGASLYLFLSILYFYKPGKTYQLILFIFLFANPLFLYLGNYVNSDPLFAALSLGWFTQLIWLMQKPMVYNIFVHALLLFLCFTTRNNAYYYPLLAIVAFLICARNWKYRAAGILLPFLLIIPFVLHTRSVARQMTGTSQFSLFTGWQLANNALYMYRNLNVDPSDLPSNETRELDSLSKNFYNGVVPEFHDYLGEYTGNYFIRQSEAPLKQYLFKHYSLTNQQDIVIGWGKASAVFSQYGSYLIKHNPSAYIRDYMWLNAKNYFITPLEKLEVYNLGQDSVEEIAGLWFNLKGLKTKSISKRLQGVLLFPIPPLFFLLNLYLVIRGLHFLATRKYKTTDRPTNRFLLLCGSFLTLNFCFCVTATIIVFRYQFFPMIILMAVSLMLLQGSERVALNSSLQPPLKPVL